MQTNTAGSAINKRSRESFRVCLARNWRLLGISVFFIIMLRKRQLAGVAVVSEVAEWAEHENFRTLKVWGSMYLKHCLNRLGGGEGQRFANLFETLEISRLWRRSR